MSQAPPHGRIAFAVIHPLTLHGGLEEELLKALQPSARVEHYGREWILGKIDVRDRVLYGKLGFDRTGTGTTYDPDTQDFVQTDRAEGTYSLFALRPDTLRIAFQTRGNVIKPQSFVTALQALLNRTSPTERWRVDHDREEETFYTWLGHVRRVQRVKVTVNRPNPHYEQQKVEEIIEGLNAQTAELIAKADPNDPQGLDRNDDLLQQLIRHADRYGSVTAKGENVDGVSVQFHSEKHRGEIEVEVDPATKDVAERTLGNLLSEPEEP